MNLALQVGLEAGAEAMQTEPGAGAPATSAPVPAAAAPAVPGGEQAAVQASGSSEAAGATGSGDQAGFGKPTVPYNRRLLLKALLRGIAMASYTTSEGLVIRLVMRFVCYYQYSSL